ncbi:MAG: hypothetical protein ALAOOOJD_03757 [bacterium]|nr:hypothetical protein [bacterium]
MAEGDERIVSDADRCRIAQHDGRGESAEILRDMQAGPFIPIPARKTANEQFAIAQRKGIGQNHSDAGLHVTIGESEMANLDAGNVGDGIFHEKKSSYLDRYTLDV